MLGICAIFLGYRQMVRHGILAPILQVRILLPQFGRNAICVIYTHNPPLQPTSGMLIKGAARRRWVLSSIIPLCLIVSKDIKILCSPHRHKMDIGQWRNRQTLNHKTTTLRLGTSHRMNKAVKEPVMVLPVVESRCHVVCKSQPIQHVKLNQVTLRSACRDRR